MLWKAAGIEGGLLGKSIITRVGIAGVDLTPIFAIGPTHVVPFVVQRIPLAPTSTAPPPRRAVPSIRPAACGEQPVVRDGIEISMK